MRCKWGVILVLSLLVSCREIDEVVDSSSGFSTSKLYSGRIQLNSEESVFASSGRMKALGLNSVCVVLRSGYPMPSQSQLEQDFELLLQGGTLLATLITADGKEYQLSGAAPAWNLRGVISSSEELSACTYGESSPLIPDGALIASVRLRTDKPITVLGVYWRSMPRIFVPENQAQR
jgi:hypothetical protein